MILTKEFKTVEKVLKDYLDLYVLKIEKIYNNFIEKSKRENIAWSNVQYLDFEYKIKSGGPSEVISGIVSYKYNDKKFKAKVFAIWTGEEYRFIEIKGPY